MKPQGKNLFGGGNKNSLYTPMSEIEQEFISRVAEAGDFRIHILGHGVVSEPLITIGDLRVSFMFNVPFDHPEVPQPLWYLDLELRHASGVLLFKERQPTTLGGQPQLAGKGLMWTMAWDIAVKAMAPKVVKDLMPSAFGLTSRWVDKDTGKLSHLGNSQLSSRQKIALVGLRQGEQKVREYAHEKVLETTRKSNGK